MFSPEVLESEYNKMKMYRSRFHILKKDKWRFYKNHKKEIDMLNEIYESFETEEESDNFQKKHQVLRTYLLLSFLVSNYKQEYRKLLKSTKPFDKDRYVIGLMHDDNVGFDLYDLVSKELVSMDKYDDDQKKYIIEGLRKSNSFICYATVRDLPLFETIVNDIKYKYKNVDKDKVPTCNDINIDYLKACIFDNPKQLNNKDKINKLMDKNIEDSHRLLTEGKITEEEFYIRYYYYMIIKKNDVENLYLREDEDMKPYVLEAYYRLSSYSELSDEFPYHERTCSPLINRGILRTKYKKESE